VHHDLLVSAVSVEHRRWSSHPGDGRDFILVPPEKGRTVVVYQKDGAFDLLDTMLITGVSFDPIAGASLAN
jgi:hypothetical protein